MVGFGGAVTAGVVPDNAIRAEGDHEHLMLDVGAAHQGSEDGDKSGRFGGGPGILIDENGVTAGPGGDMIRGTEELDDLGFGGFAPLDLGGGGRVDLAADRGTGGQKNKEQKGEK